MRCEDREGRPDGALGVVLVGGGRPEEGHDPVAQVALDDPAVPGDLALEQRVVGMEEGPHVLGVERLGAGREAGEVGEQDGDGLALLADLGGSGQGLRARATEPEAIRVRAAAGRAAGHRRSIGAWRGGRIDPFAVGRSAKPVRPTRLPEPEHDHRRAAAGDHGVGDDDGRHVARNVDRMERFAVVAGERRIQRRLEGAPADAGPEVRAGEVHEDRGSHRVRSRRRGHRREDVGRLGIEPDAGDRPRDGRLGGPAGPGVAANGSLIPPGVGRAEAATGAAATRRRKATSDPTTVSRCPAVCVHLLAGRAIRCSRLPFITSLRVRCAGRCACGDCPSSRAACETSLVTRGVVIRHCDGARAPSGLRRRRLAARATSRAR